MTYLRQYHRHIGIGIGIGIAMTMTHPSVLCAQAQYLDGLTHTEGLREATENLETIKETVANCRFVSPVGTLTSVLLLLLVCPLLCYCTLV